jgi:hypothetical protein
MKIRTPILTFAPLIGLLLACWWLLAKEIVLLQPLRGDLGTTLHIALFAAPFYILWRLAQ